MDNSNVDEPVRLSLDQIQKAHERLSPPVKLTADQLRRGRLRVRLNNFDEVEPVPLRQQFLGTEVSGRRVNSCTVAAALLALNRIGEIRGMTITEKMKVLESDLIQQAVARGDFANNPDTGVSTTSEVFSAFGLVNGYARSLTELEAALRAGGGAVIAYDGHARCISEEKGGEMKIFDPLQPETLKARKDFINDKIALLNGGITSNAIVVYPSEYVPDPQRGETFSGFRLNSSVPLQIDPQKYLS